MGQPSHSPDPEKTLARIIKAELGIVIAPEALRIFIRANWGRVSGLAHDIHRQSRAVDRRYMNTADGKIYVLVSEEDGLATFKREGRETLRYLSSAEFHNRFFTQEEIR